MSAAVRARTPGGKAGGRRAGRGGKGRRLPRGLGGIGLRGRLTLLHTGLFFVAGTALLWVTYLLTARALEQRITSKLPRKAALVPVRPAPPLETPSADMPRTATVALVQQVTDGADVVLAELVRNSILVMVVLGALAVLLGWLVTDRVLRPLHRVTETAERLSESTLHERIALDGPQDDVKRLADTFDSMLDRLQRAFDAQRRFVNNASHELRTPIAITRTLIEVALEEPDASEDLRVLGKALLSANARHERLIEGLLLLARSENEPPVLRPVDLAEVIRSALEQLQPTAERRKVAVTAELEPVVANGEAVLLERCAVNVVENAIKYNMRGGDVIVRLARERGDAVLTVENTGPVIPAYEVDGLFEPFRRLQDRVGSAQGAGLGLSIVRAIATAHGGTARAAARPGGGLIVTLSIPSASPASRSSDRRPAGCPYTPSSPSPPPRGPRSADAR